MFLVGKEEYLGKVGAIRAKSVLKNDLKVLDSIAAKSWHCEELSSFLEGSLGDKYPCLEAGAISRDVQFDFGGIGRVSVAAAEAEAAVIALERVAVVVLEIVAEVKHY